jgi:MFS transporter, DHA1 family, tetracycline resistance protein
MSESGLPPGPRRATLAFIFVTVVLDMLALGMVVPVLPHLIEDFLGGDTARAARMVGYFGTVWAVMQFFAMPVMGGLSDRFGRRPVILLSNLGLGLDYVLMAMPPSAGVRSSGSARTRTGRCASCAGTVKSRVSPAPRSSAT